MEAVAPEILIPAAQAPRPAPPYPTVGESWAVLGWYLLLNLVVGVPLLLLLGKGLGLSKPMVGGITLVVVDLGLLGLLRWKAGPRWLPLRLWGQEKPAFYLALLVLLPALEVVLTLLYFLHLPNWLDATFRDLMKQPILAFATICLAGPILEEVLFRGVVLKGLLRTKRPWVAIGLSSLIFGLMHMNPVQIVGAGLIGVLLGWLYYRTQSLALCIAGHVLNNTLAFAAMLNPKVERIDNPVELFHSVGAYLAALLLSALLLAALLRWVAKSTTPAAYSPAAPLLAPLPPV